MKLLSCVLIILLTQSSMIQAMNYEWDPSITEKTRKRLEEKIDPELSLKQRNKALEEAESKFLKSREISRKSYLKSRSKDVEKMREKGRENYHKLSPEEKKARSKKSNDKMRAKRALRSEEQISQDKEMKKKYDQEHLTPELRERMAANQRNKRASRTEEQRKSDNKKIREEKKGKKDEINDKQRERYYINRDKDVLTRDTIILTRIKEDGEAKNTVSNESEAPFEESSDPDEVKRPRKRAK